MRRWSGGGLSALAFVLLAAGNTAALEVHVVDKQGRPPADAVVFARPGGTVAPSPSRTAIINQVNQKFEPRVSVLAKGTTVSFPNKDDIKHHVYSFSPPKVFQLKLYHGVTAAPVTFDKAGLVVLGCNIHDGMIAYVYVVDAPYFALTDATGTVQLTSLPTGDYALQSWHYQMSDDDTATPPGTLHVEAATPAQTLTVALRQDLPLPPPLE